jgi:hypothetical protein
VCFMRICDYKFAVYGFFAEHRGLKAEFVPTLRVESFHRSDSEDCTIVTIERHSPDGFSTGPLYM